MGSVVRRHPIAAFFVLAWAFSWVFMVPLALAKHGVLPPLPGWLHYLSAYGPLVAALLVAASTEGRAGLRALGTRLTRWRAGTAWWALAVSPILLYLVAAVAERITQGAWPDARQLGQLNFLPYVGIWSLPLWLFNSGLGEEGGWRGYALPMLQRRLSPRAASLAIAGGWMIWHVPAFFYLPSYEHLGAGMMIGFFDGRHRISAHFQGDMPRWGARYRIDQNDKSQTEQSVRERISALVDYVESIQEK